jgi:hypothetical protein
MIRIDIHYLYTDINLSRDTIYTTSSVHRSPYPSCQKIDIVLLSPKFPIAKIGQP